MEKAIKALSYAAMRENMLKAFLKTLSMTTTLLSASQQAMEREYAMLAYQFSLKAKGPNHYCSCDTSFGYRMIK